MGASLAHLCIINCNITKKEMVGMHASIDISITNPIERAKDLNSREKVLAKTKWDKNDLIIQLVTVPCCRDPVGYLLDEEKINDYDINISCSQNDLDAIKIDNFTLFNKI